MKKLVSLLLVILLLPVSATSLAAGKATVTQEVFYVTASYDGTFDGIVFGEITNTGDKDVAIDSGVYELFDVDGEAIASGKIYSFYPEIIQPGEKSFFSISGNAETATKSTDIDDYSVTVVGKSAKENAITILPSTCSFEEYNDYKNTRNTDLYIIIENNTDDIVSGTRAVWAVYDKEGRLIYVDSTSTYVGILPGSKIQLSTRIDSDIQAVLNTAGTDIGEVVVNAWCD